MVLVVEPRLLEPCGSWRWCWGWRWCWWSSRACWSRVGAGGGAGAGDGAGGRAAPAGAVWQLEVVHGIAAATALAPRAHHALSTQRAHVVALTKHVAGVGAVQVLQVQHVAGVHCRPLLTRRTSDVNVGVN